MPTQPEKKPQPKKRQPKQKPSLPSPPSSSKPSPRPFSSPSNWWLLLILAGVLVYLFYASNREGRSEITYGMFRGQLAEKNIQRVRIQGAKVLGTFKKAPADPVAKPDSEGKRPLLNEKFETTLPAMALSDPLLDHELLEQLNDAYIASEPTDNTFTVLIVYMLITVGLFVALWLMFRKARDSLFSGGMAGGFAKSGARRYEADDRPITFADVAGLEGVKTISKRSSSSYAVRRSFSGLAPACRRESC